MYILKLVAMVVVPREVLCHIHLSSGLCCDTSVTTGPKEPPQDVWYGVT